MTKVLELYYSCSVACFKVHKDNCKQEPKPEIQTAPVVTSAAVPSLETAASGAIDPTLLEQSTSVQAMLHNPHLRELLSKIEDAADPMAALDDALSRPLFAEFAEACLATVRPIKDEL
eukprot:Colp12_sorted_trinity150504_noHs@16557